MTIRTLEIKTTDAELQHTLPLTTEDGQTIAMNQLQATAASLLPDKELSLRYMDSDGDHVTITSDADLKELDKFMQDEQLQRLEVLAVPQDPATAQRAVTTGKTQLRGLVTAMSKLTAKTETKPTPASAMNLLVTSLQAMDVVEDAGERNLRSVVEELSTTEEFKELADTMVAAIYEEDAQAIEDAATARFNELLVFAQRVVARCPSLKPVMVNVTKSLMTGLVRYNDNEMDGDASDSPSCSSSSSCCSDDQETVDVEVLTEEVPLHLGVICDGCEKAPLVGVRYKSLEVPNFDLCEECEASGKYIRYEPFIKITDPSRAPKQKRISELVHPCVTRDGCEMSPIVGVRFKSQTKENFDLCERCEVSGNWPESHGPFTKIDEPTVMRAFKFTCRRGGKFGHHGKFGRHHHSHAHHGKFGRHHSKHGHGKHHHRGRGKVGRHGHCHGSPDFPFHGRHPDHHNPPGLPAHGFPGHGFPFHHEGRPAFAGHCRPNFQGHHHDPVSPSEFDDRRRPHGPMGLASVASDRPRFEHGHPPFPAEFEHWDTHVSTDTTDTTCDSRTKAMKTTSMKKITATTGDTIAVDVDAKVFTDEEMQVVDTTEMRVTPSEDAAVVNVDSEDKVDYSEALKQLTSMGFDDTGKNILALELARGNIGGAVNALLSE
ncbi:Ubiquitin-associated domain [Phytophthora cactorum]|nr:Ubiquitin-associated domain [Phytophthora cactorum]